MFKKHVPEDERPQCTEMYSRTEICSCQLYQSASD